MSFEPKAPSEHVISIRDLSKRYPLNQSRLAFVWQLVRQTSIPEKVSFAGLDGVSFDVVRGESVAIIGKNGSGKSTLLEVIANTLFPTSGAVKVTGKVTGLLELGAGFHPDYSGRENVYSYGALLGLTAAEIDRRYHEIVAFADIGDFMEQPVKTYSSGMYVRLAFSVAALVEPDILLIDEALAVGDILFQQKCIRHLKKQLGSITLLFVTHSLNLVSTLATRTIVLDAGRMVYDGPPKEAIEHYIQLIHADYRAPSDDPVSPVFRSGEDADEDQGIDWMEVPASQLTGRQNVVIAKFAVLTRDGTVPRHVTTGDKITVHMLLRATQDCPEAIFGYLVADRLGNYVFGENTCSVANGLCELHKGHRYHVRFQFDWPEIRPGEYTLTLGAGEGSDAMHHVVQCWAQNVHVLESNNREKPVHAIFNNAIEEFSIACCE